MNALETLKKVNAEASAFELLKRVITRDKPFRSFSKLEPGIYPIWKFQLSEGKFGKRLRIELKDCLITLPERFIYDVTPESVDELNLGQYKMIYKGRDASRNNRILVDFEPDGNTEN